MKILIQRWIGVVLFGLVLRTGGAQDIELSQYWSAPLHVNPALAGISYGPRVSLNYRNQWPQLGDGFNGGFTTYMAGADMYIQKAHSGIGLLYTGDYIANGLLASNKLTLSYAVQVRLTKKVGMRLGLEGSFIERHIKWGDLQFYDMINPYTGFYNNVNILNPTAEPAPERLQTFRGDFGAGLLFFSEKLYGGLAMRNAIMPKESFYQGSKASKPFRFTAHLGSHFDIKHPRNYRYKIFVSPNVLVANQGRNVQFNAGIMAGVSVVYFGAWFRYALQNPDAFILVLGFKKGKVRFGYSYDITMSKLGGQTGGSHELSLVFNWSGSDDNSLNPKANKGYIPCPEILHF
ncbi:MAG: PorP/SprF family type IX secretion system membrane protein [Chitinophagales bacterium]